MSTEETKVTTNEVVEETKEAVKAPEVNQNGSDSKGDEVPVKEDKKDEVNEQILEFLKKQSATIEKQNKTIEELIKANEETHKKMTSLSDRVQENIPEIIGSYNYEADLKALGKKGMEARRQRAKESLDLYSSMFNFV